MDNSIKNEAPAETRAPIGDLMANIIIEIDGLKELKDLTEALTRFQEKGLAVNYKVNP